MQGHLRTGVARPGSEMGVFGEHDVAVAGIQVLAAI